MLQVLLGTHATHDGKYHLSVMVVLFLEVTMFRYMYSIIIMLVHQKVPLTVSCET